MRRFAFKSLDRSWDRNSAKGSDYKGPYLTLGKKGGGGGGVLLRGSFVDNLEKDSDDRYGVMMGGVLHCWWRIQYLNMVCLVC